MCGRAYVTAEIMPLPAGTKRKFSIFNHRLILDNYNKFLFGLGILRKKCIEWPFEIITLYACK